MKGKKNFKFIFWEVMVHLLLIGTITICVLSGIPENLNKAKEISIHVDHVNYTYERREYRLSLYSDSIEYKFSTYDCEYTIQELSRLIKKGDLLTIKYIENFNIFYGDYYEIIDARNESTVYLSLEAYSSKQNTSLLICILLVSILLSILVVMDALIVWSHIYDKKRMQRIKLFQIIEKYGSDNYRVIKNLDTKLYARFESEYCNYWLDAYDASKYARKNEFVIKKENTSEEDKTNMGYLVVFGNDNYDITFYDLEKYGRYKKDVLEEKEQVNIIDQDDFAALIDKYLKM